MPHAAIGPAARLLANATTGVLLLLLLLLNSISLSLLLHSLLLTAAWQIPIRPKVGKTKLCTSLVSHIDMVAIINAVNWYVCCWLGPLWLGALWLGALWPTTGLPATAATWKERKII